MDVLIIEDEAAIAQLVQLVLEQEGFKCVHCPDGESGLQCFQERAPDVVILDQRLPGLDGLEVCARIRQGMSGKDPYILMLTARGEEIDRIIGLSTGADDYVVKPFSPRELVARVRALLRRSLRHGGVPLQPANLYRTQHFLVDLDQYVAYRLDDYASGDRSASDRSITSPPGHHPPGHHPRDPRDTIALELTTLEFKLLATFVRAPSRVWSRTQLIDQLWGSEFFGDERVVDTHVARLRKKIELDPANPIYVKTVIGVGYKFEDGLANPGVGGERLPASEWGRFERGGEQDHIEQRGES